MLFRSERTPRDWANLYRYTELESLAKNLTLLGIYEGPSAAVLAYYKAKGVPDFPSASSYLEMFSALLDGGIMQAPLKASLGMNTRFVPQSAISDAFDAAVRAHAMRATLSEALPAQPLAATPAARHRL